MFPALLAGKTRLPPCVRTTGAPLGPELLVRPREKDARCGKAFRSWNVGETRVDGDLDRLESLEVREETLLERREVVCRRVEDWF